MKQEARSLQKMLEEQLGELPRLLATQLVRDKLDPLGHSENERLVAAIVDKLLSGDGEDSFELDDKLFEGGAPEGGISIQFGDEDIAQLEKAVSGLTEELPEILTESAAAAAKAMLQNYKSDWRQWRPHAVIEMTRFKANLETRWSKGFDLLRMLIELSRDQGEAFQKRASRGRSVRRTHLNAVIVHLHARALQIASEMMALMESGFADGAMARWRTLHEVTCVAMVIDEGGDALAERYLAHEIVEAKKALGQYQQCHAALGYAAFSENAAKRIARDYDWAIAKYGKEFAGDYGWVAAHLAVARPNFSQIEEAAGRAMMRSHYKMASHNVHAGVKGIAHRLSAFESGYRAIAGSSNVGFVEPGQNLGLSLLQFTMLLLPQRWTLDKMALLRALIDLEAQIAPALARSQRAISRDERRIQRSAKSPKQHLQKPRRS